MPSLADAGIVGRANVLRECKIGWKCDPSVRIGRERVATVQKSRGGSSPKLCQTFYRRRTEVWGMDPSELGVTKRGLEGVSEAQARGNSAAEGQCLRGQAGVRQ